MMEVICNHILASTVAGILSFQSEYIIIIIIQGVVFNSRYYIIYALSNVIRDSKISDSVLSSSTVNLEMLNCGR